LRYISFHCIYAQSWFVFLTILWIKGS
jgi:hypothetical protein